jgi:tripartite-type tricarboxylate transporter receptor subunit TctC
MAQVFGRPFVVENRPGAGSVIGLDVLARSPPDGYTFGLGNIANMAIAPAVQRGRVPYDPVRDFAPVSNCAATPLLLVVNAAKVPARTVPELIAHMTANPGVLNYGSSGNGTSIHLGQALFLLQTGTNAVHVPFRGGTDMLNALLGGQVDFALDVIPTSWPHVEAGRLRALAVATPTRLARFPDLPALNEFAPGVELMSWHGVVGPAGTPAPIVGRLSEAIRAFLSEPEVLARLDQLGFVPVANTPEEFARQIAADVERFREVVARAGITAD